MTAKTAKEAAAVSTGHRLGCGCVECTAAFFSALKGERVDVVDVRVADLEGREAWKGGEL